ncbi:hypothetical protein BC343_29015 [Mucilaginibacter pedocola]|uniref:Uncharacterized protein n=1 Tax=Mucilaginibacter pedocola TaxID=1792845 RepID=A0A1S9PE21_9SPHI|nr:hypothetical protein BC343_29015 [Mucilaginibacter pedocola]
MLEELVGLLTGKIKSDKVRLLSTFTYADHIRKFKRFWIPITVNSYLKRHANPANSIYEKAFIDPRVRRKTKIVSLPGNLRRELAIYTVLSNTNNIIFDLAGVDHEGGVTIYNNVKEAIDVGGAAILIDTCDEFKNDCTTFVKAEYLGPKIAPLPPFSAK